MFAARAAEAPSTSGSDGIASGTQVVSDVAAPVALSGNTISVLGDSSARQDTTAAPAAPTALDAAPLGLAPTTTGIGSGAPPPAKSTPCYRLQSGDLLTG
nr:chaplin family protein [Cryobacterium ruanii]